MYCILNPNEAKPGKSIVLMTTSNAMLKNMDWQERFNNSPLSNRYMARNNERKFQRVHLSSFTSNLVVQDYFKQFHPQPINLLGLGEFNPLDWYMVFPKVIINW